MVAVLSRILILPLIRQELPQSRRLIELNKVAITQMRSLAGSKEMKQLE
jgi:hypothetical protein